MAAPSCNRLDGPVRGLERERTVGPYRVALEERGVKFLCVRKLSQCLEYIIALFQAENETRQKFLVKRVPHPDIRSMRGILLEPCFRSGSDGNRRGAEWDHSHIPFVQFRVHRSQCVIDRS